MRLLLFLTLLLLSLPAGIFAEAPHPPYAVARIPTPVLNTPAFAAVFGGKGGTTLKLDRCGQVREVEFIALPGTVFRIEGELRQGTATIYRVTSGDYPYPAKTGYFIDSRFVTTSLEQPPERTHRLPYRQVIIARLLAAEGASYVWGGNVREGVPEMGEFYPPAEVIPSSRLSNQWALTGLDCSGLLYEATGGFTPRNTSALVSYGTGIPLAGLTASEIARKVEPLDLIVWNGHVQIVLDRERLIESRLVCNGTGGGVVVRPLREALADLVRHRKPLDDYGTGKGKGFVLRRWYQPKP